MHPIVTQRACQTDPSFAMLNAPIIIMYVVIGEKKSVASASNCRH